MWLLQLVNNFELKVNKTDENAVLDKNHIFKGGDSAQPVLFA